MGNLTACCSNFWISLTCKEMSRCAKPFPLPFSCPAKPGGELEKDLRLRKVSLFSWQTQIIGRINHFLNQQPIILGYMFIYIMEIPDLSIHLMFTQPHQKQKPLWLLSTRRSSPDSKRLASARDPLDSPRRRGILSFAHNPPVFACKRARYMNNIHVVLLIEFHSKSFLKVNLLFLMVTWIKYKHCRWQNPESVSCKNQVSARLLDLGIPEGQGFSVYPRSALFQISYHLVI